ncbi:hypothetical protein Syun_025166 [Stephania yunnanensis]|uniref:Uncharacterized protein n=1 Tax=Stephania yunnanensis TaxID=152371 RepID=A0AAP0ER63_9MAGN
MLLTQAFQITGESHNFFCTSTTGTVLSYAATSASPQKLSCLLHLDVKSTKYYFVLKFSRLQIFCA